MKVIKHADSLWLDIGRLSVTLGLVRGFYLGIQIDANHVSIDLGLVFIDIYW